MSAPPWPPRPRCTHAGRRPAPFGSLFTAPLGEVADVADLIGTAYAYVCALARHPAFASHRHDGDACDGGDGGTGVCDDCGGRRLAAAFGAAPHPERSRCTAFLTSLRTGAYRDATGMVKAALLGGVVKVVGDLLRAVYVEGAPRLPGGRGEVAVLGRNPFLRPVPDLCSSHVGECAVLVLSSGFPVARDRSELQAAATEWPQWACDHRGEEHYAYADRLRARPPRPGRGRSPRGWTPSTPTWPVANRSSCPCGRGALPGR
ncbi:hypothetical protein ACFWA6_24115 [Streptomyces sp. NPDC060020]|uniref:hypothetical protein n=1 Tax=Streptomyces sp. NPDC060020 TaxID=3347038 RepID=UPI0036B3CE04